MEKQFSDESLSDLRDIEDYLINRWNEKVFEDFLLKLNNIVEIILEGNVVFQKYEDTDLRKILITKHNTLIYVIENGVLKIVRILQNFQDPGDNYQSFEK